MAPIPSSNLPGHAALHERVIAALDRCQESRSIDFKESAPWEPLRWRIVKTIMAMANLPDGGIVVIGASERSDVWELTGMATGDLSTYDVDDVTDVANSYASPHIDLDIVEVRYNNRVFVAIHAHEFADTPIVCRKVGTDPRGSTRLEAGAIYVRPPGVAQTLKVNDARQLHELLELAAEKRARRLLETARRINLFPGLDANDRFAAELEGL